MKRLHYVSPSLLPARSANSVHVMLQCDGLVKAGARVTLYAKRTVQDPTLLKPALKIAYGVDHPNLDFVTYFSRMTLADTLRIATVATVHIANRPRAEAVLSRNLYAAYTLGVIARRPLIFETHQLEFGARKSIQRAVMTRPWVTTVAISQRLVECLTEHHGVAPRQALVLHDAAPDGFTPVEPAARRAVLSSVGLKDIERWDAICGYFGHLYPGRGIEIIEAMASLRPGCLFLVFGGNESDVAVRRAACRAANVRYMGHVPHPVARQAMTGVEVLLMPYQERVSIGVKAHDTARWMSPMKMFEYLATGVPVISSDLPVLREVLHDNQNCLLVPANDPVAWVGALDRIVGTPTLSRALGERAHADYLQKYRWTQRAEALIAAARGL
jgi:glycosyltransferase involved in cell wall biosynthesis